MHYVYILRSKRDGKLYVGVTSDLRKRLDQHNNGQNVSTKSRVPLKLVYYEAFLSKTDACQREAKLKKFKNTYKQLKKRIEGSLEDSA